MLSATRGVKQTQIYKNSHSDQNLIAISTLLQEKKNITSQLEKGEYQNLDQALKTESGMFYEISNRKRMECERYQDCSWFQEDSAKGKSNCKLSLVEAAGQFIDTDEFDIAMQVGNAHTIPWEDDCLGIFDDDKLLDMENKFGEVKNIFDSYKENNMHLVHKTEENNIYDINDVNYNLKKIDSFDSIKNISSTDPAEIIPISFKEKLNNSNYSLTILNEIKSEFKEEMESHSPDSVNYVVESDDSDLSIGREEVVEQENSVVDIQNEVKEKVYMPLKVLDNFLGADRLQNNNHRNSLKKENMSCTISNTKEIPHPQPKVEGCSDEPDDKLNLNLDLGKVNFVPPMGINTPELDFMDLVDYINDEMHQANEGSVTKECSDSELKIEKSTDLVNNSDPQIVFSKQTLTKIDDPEKNVQIKPFDTKSISDLPEKNISIAERIKIGAKRRTSRKYNLKEENFSEDEEENFDNSEDDDDDDDFDYNEALSKQNYIAVRKRSTSTESRNNRRQVNDSQIDSYRERRDKNNEASRRSRQNRKDREKRMFKTLEEEERRNVKLKAEAEVLEKQITSLRQLLLQVVLKKGGPT